MPTNTTAWSIGDLVQIDFLVRSTAGVLTNSDVRLVLNSPGGTVTVAAATSTAPASTAWNHVSTGTWQYKHKPSSAGRYTYHFTSTGTITVSTGGAFAVAPRKAST